MPFYLKREGVIERKKNGTKKVDFYEWLGLPYYLILLMLIVIPVLLIIMYAITFRDPGSPIIRFTLRYFSMFLSERDFVKVLFESIRISVLTTVFTLLIGYPTAYFIARARLKTQVLLLLLMTAPMWINMLLRTLAWKQILEIDGPVVRFLHFLGFTNVQLLGTDFAIVLGMVYVFLPFMVLPIYTVISKIDPKLLEASHDLGANNRQTFLRVVLPLSVSGVLSGIIMVMLPSATTLVIPKYLGEGRYYLIGNLIEERFLKSGIWGYGSAIAIVLALIIMGMVYVTKKADRYNLES